MRIILGIVLLVASISKLSIQSQFINEVAGYGLLPQVLGRAYGLVLPWLELFTGCALILGFFTTSALVLCLLMALSFTVANIYVLAQGITGNCASCFGQLITLSNITALVIDVLMVTAAVLLLFYRGKVASLNIGNFFLAKLNLNIPRMSKQSTQKISQAILLAVIGLAIGVPLSWGQETRTASNCRADFSANLESVAGIVPIRFTDQSEGDVITWEWDFDSNGTIDSTERNPVYSYSSDGVYSVSLTIRTPDCQATVTKRDYIAVTGCAD